LLSVWHVCAEASLIPSVHLPDEAKGGDKRDEEQKRKRKEVEKKTYLERGICYEIEVRFARNFADRSIPFGVGL
jgi:hypothetical protein